MPYLEGQKPDQTRLLNTMLNETFEQQDNSLVGVESAHTNTTDWSAGMVQQPSTHTRHSSGAHADGPDERPVGMQIEGEEKDR